VLLIVAALDDGLLGDLYRLAGELGLAALVEVHDAAELGRALALGPAIVGVNNRDLRTFEVDLETTARLRPLVPRGTVLVAESGVRDRADVERVSAIGADAALVGEALVRAEDPGAQVRHLLGREPAADRSRVKICGLTNLEDAVCAAEAGADLLGFVFYPKSPRFVQPERVAGISRAIRRRFGGGAPRLVGVFVDEAPARVGEILEAAGLDLAQLHGHETPEEVRALAPRAFKAIRPGGDGRQGVEAGAAAYYAAAAAPGPAPELLVDAYHPRHLGGSGTVADLEAARRLARRCRLLLAGGLTPETVAAAVARVRPWGVDVSSGVELSPGRKDHGRLRAFVEAARQGGDGR
jgi:phosphoribosylanthranilate isomerase